MTERDQELGQNETELAQEEAALVSEITRMMAAATEFERKVRSVRAVLAEASMGGQEDKSLSKRVGAMGVPPLETEAIFAKARKVRAEAVNARTQANQHVREAVTAWKTQLSALNAQVLNDEKSAQQLVAQMKKARAAEEPVEVPASVVEVPPALRRAQNQPTQLMPAVSAPSAPKPAGIESKRQSQRVKMQAEVNMSSDDNFFSGFSANISDGGLFIATVNYVPKGTQVDLSFSLPTGQQLEVKGVVRWIREVNDKDPASFPGLGIQFADLAEDAQLAIRSFIEHRDPMFYVD